MAFFSPAVPLPVHLLASVFPFLFCLRSLPRRFASSYARSTSDSPLSRARAFLIRAAPPFLDPSFFKTVLHLAFHVFRLLTLSRPLLCCSLSSLWPPVNYGTISSHHRAGLFFSTHAIFPPFDFSTLSASSAFIRFFLPG